MEKAIDQYTREEFLAMENFNPSGPFSAFVIVPTDEIHDSGWRCMKFILLYQGEIVGVVSGWSDVVHINGIGGYGKNYGDLVSGMVKRVGWSIDCLPVSGCIRLFGDAECEMEDYGWVGSDFIFYVR